MRDSDHLGGLPAGRRAHWDLVGLGGWGQNLPSGAVGHELRLWCSACVRHAWRQLMGRHQMAQGLMGMAHHA